MAISAHQNVNPIDTTTPPRTTLKMLTFAPAQKNTWKSYSEPHAMEKKNNPRAASYASR